MFCEHRPSRLCSHVNSGPAWYYLHCGKFIDNFKCHFTDSFMNSVFHFVLIIDNHITCEVFLQHRGRFFFRPCKYKVDSARKPGHRSTKCRVSVLAPSSVAYCLAWANTRVLTIDFTILFIYLLIYYYFCRPQLFGVLVWDCKLKNYLND